MIWNVIWHSTIDVGMLLFFSEHVYLDLWRYHGDGILKQNFPRMIQDNEGFGPMPTFEEMAKLRGADCRNEAYDFLIQVFGAAVYGETIFKDVIDYSPVDGPSEEGKKKRWEEAMTRFTVNDEAFIITILKDCWKVWLRKAKREFKQKLWEHSTEEWFSDNDIENQINTSAMVQHVYSGGLNSSRGMSEEGLDYFDSIEDQIINHDRVGGRSDKFMEFLCRSYRSRLNLIGSSSRQGAARKIRKRNFK